MKTGSPKDDMHDLLFCELKKLYGPFEITKHK